MNLPFPDFFLNTPSCTVVLYEEALAEDGSPVAAVTWSGAVNFSEKSKTTLSADGKAVALQGKVVCKGDIAPTLKTLSNGAVTIATKTYMVYRASRPRNPDGTVHHTTLELL